eukprot:g12836.t1
MISAPWGSEGAMLYGAQGRDGHVVLRLVTATGPQSPFYEVSGISRAFTLVQLSPWKVAVALSSLAGGALWTVPRRQCRPPLREMLGHRGPTTW